VLDNGGAGALEQVGHRDRLTLKRGSKTNRPTNAAADGYSSQTSLRLVSRFFIISLLMMTSSSIIIAVFCC
jgi:hypothetical protein